MREWRKFRVIDKEGVSDEDTLVLAVEKITLLTFFEAGYRQKPIGNVIAFEAKIQALHQFQGSDAIGGTQFEDDGIRRQVLLAEELVAEGVSSRACSFKSAAEAEIGNGFGKILFRKFFSL